MITEGKKVTINCAGKLENGMVFTDSSADGPIEFEVGQYDVIKGLNNAVMGMAIGEEKKVIIEPNEAFGEYNEKLLASIPKENLPPDAQVGMQLKSDDPETGEVIWSIKEIPADSDSALIDGNHILAGQKLEFDLKIVDIK